MIKSIRYFLLLTVLLCFIFAWVINSIGNNLLGERVIEPYLDHELVKMSSLVMKLYESNLTDENIKREFIDSLFKSEPFVGQKLQYQIWSPDNKLLMHYPESFTAALQASIPGMRNQTINNHYWRTYTAFDAKQKIKVIVTESYTLRQDIAGKIIGNNISMLLITCPLFSLLIWFIINFALKSITRVATEISNRAPSFLEPVSLVDIPIEIKPLVAKLNQLLTRLKLALERNKRFSADAAHELHTPLAALKTHVQVALKTDNDTDRVTALEKVIESVDRSAHVVAQLLTLSRLSAEETLTDVMPFDLYKLAVEIIAYLAPLALEKDIEIELAPAPTHAVILGNDTSIGILIRNIVDNAIRYTPNSGEIHISIIETAEKIILSVRDSGPGISSEFREQVFERFYRILGTQASGSGLGLAIVKQIASLHHAEILLNVPSNGKGLQFDVVFPKYQA